MKVSTEHLIQQEEEGLNQGTRVHVKKSLSSHMPANPRAARHDTSLNTLTRHYSSQRGHIQSELEAPEIHAKREAAMRDAQENYEIMMEFYKELSDAFSKIIGEDPSVVSERR
ncbi:MAG: hypothetical protein WC222_03170 [Parachlamydiales bacterium]|jgi:hypothetical protein